MKGLYHEFAIFLNFKHQKPYCIHRSKYLRKDMVRRVRFKKQLKMAVLLSFFDATKFLKLINFEKHNNKTFSEM